MRISSPFLSQLEVWSDHAPVNAQLDPKTIQSNQRKCVINLAIRASSHQLRTANKPPAGSVAAAQTVYFSHFFTENISEKPRMFSPLFHF
jgi:hypothetical protein